jgi:hypothetical protein
LELSLFALIDVATERAFALSARQTPPSQGSDTSTHRMAHYTQHYRETLAHIPERVRYIVADGAYARKEFIEDVRSSDRHLVTRLRCDANLRYLYRGPQRGGRGRIKRYAGKVDLSDASSMDFVKETRPGIKLYTALVNSPHFKQDYTDPLNLAATNKTFCSTNGKSWPLWNLPTMCRRPTATNPSNTEARNGI